MMLSLLLLFSLQGTLRVDGLRDGERFRPQVSPAKVNLENGRYGRVREACTDTPVAGAEIEIWTEEISGPGQGFHKVGQATSGAGGGFRVTWREGGVEADKILVRASGYLTFPGTVSDLDLVRLMPDSGWQTQLLVVDLMDQPIEGARVTSTYSCAHDVPALDLATGQDGRAILESYGLQAQTGSLRVQANGFSTRKYVEWRDVLCYAGCKEPAIVRLPRQARVRARILTADGVALKNRVLVVHDGEGDHVPTTDDKGRFALNSRYGATSVQIDVLGKSEREFVYVGNLPREREVVLRIDGGNWPADLPQARLVLKRKEGEESQDPVAVSVFHQDGWWINTVESKGSSFPAGKSLVLIGEAFSPWEQRLIELDLQAGETFTLHPVKSPQLEISAPDDTHSILVQAGDQSIELRGNQHLVVPVPRGEELVLLAEGARTRRLVLPGLLANATADLRPKACLLPPTRNQLAASVDRRVMRVQVLGAGVGKLKAKGVTELATKSLGENLYEVNAPIGLPVLLHYSADGFADSWVAKMGGEPSVTMRPVKLASLFIDNRTGEELTLESMDPSELEGLNPGPLTLAFRLEDGRAGVLSLLLKPGEDRTLVIKD